MLAKSHTSPTGPRTVRPGDATLTVTKAARILGVDQPKVSAVVRGHLEKFSLERLCEFLTRLGCDVDIRVRERAKRATPGKVSVRTE